MQQVFHSGSWQGRTIESRSGEPGGNRVYLGYSPVNLKRDNPRARSIPEEMKTLREQGIGIKELRSSFLPRCWLPLSCRPRPVVPRIPSAAPPAGTAAAIPAAPRRMLLAIPSRATAGAIPFADQRTPSAIPLIATTVETPSGAPPILSETAPTATTGETLSAPAPTPLATPRIVTTAGGPFDAARTALAIQPAARFPSALRISQPWNY